MYGFEFFMITSENKYFQVASNLDEIRILYKYFIKQEHYFQVDSNLDEVSSNFS